MNILIFGQNEELKASIEAVSGPVKLFQDHGLLIKEARSLEEGIVLVDMAQGAQKCELVLSELSGQTGLTTGLVSASWGSAQFKSHQQGPQPADCYFKLPMSGNDIDELLEQARSKSLEISKEMTGLDFNIPEHTMELDIEQLGEDLPFEREDSEVTGEIELEGFNSNSQTSLDDDYDKEFTMTNIDHDEEKTLFQRPIDRKNSLEMDKDDFTNENLDEISALHEFNFDEKSLTANLPDIETTDSFTDVADLDALDDELTQVENSHLEFAVPEVEEEEDERTRVLNVESSHSVNDDSSEEENYTYEAEDESEDDSTRVQTRVIPSAPTTRREEIEVGAYGQSEMLRMKGTIGQLRDERETLLSQVEAMRRDAEEKERTMLGLRAELDETKIEVSIVKKKYFSEIEDYKYKLRMADEKKEIYEERAKNLQNEVDRLNGQIKLDVEKIRKREKELEGQLELVTMDSESKIKGRDQKIMELKRKVDALEFNIENTNLKAQKNRNEKVGLEDKIQKVIRTLRDSVKTLESEVESERKVDKEI